MAFLQAVLGGIFTILGAGSLFFMAYKALTISNDLAEMKELLRQMQRGPNGANHTASYPVPLDDRYEPPMSSHPVPPLSQPQHQQPEREFVLPPPISRRLDAERGIRRESDARL